MDETRAAFEDRGLKFEDDKACEQAVSLAKDTGCPLGQLVKHYEAFADEQVGLCSSRSAGKGARSTIGGLMAPGRQTGTTVSTTLMEDFGSMARQTLARHSSKTPQPGKRR